MRGRGMLGPLAVGLAIIAALAAAAAGVLALSGGRIVAWALAHPVSRYLGRAVAVDVPVEIHWGSPTALVLRGLRVANAAWGSAPAMLEAGEVVVRVDPASLLKGRKHLPLIAVAQARLRLETAPDGERNWSFLDRLRDAAPGGEFPVLRRVTVNDAEIEFRDGATGARSEVTLRDAALEAAPDGPVALDATGEVGREPFRVTGSGAALADLGAGAGPYPLKLEGAFGGSRIAVEGRVGEPAKPGGLDLHVALQGGRLDRVAAALGRRLPPLPEMRIEGQLKGGGGVWTADRLRARLGGSAIEGAATLDLRGRVPYLRARLSAGRLDLADLLGRAGDPGSGTSLPPGPKDPGNRIVPALPLPAGWLERMNADIAFEGAELRHARGPPLTRVRAALHLADGVLRVEPLVVGVAGGEARLGLRYAAASEPPRLELELGLGRVDLRQLVTSMPVPPSLRPSAGLAGGFVRMTGSGRSLRDILAGANGEAGLFLERGELTELVEQVADFAVLQGLGLMGKSNEPVPINCLVAGFDIRAGVATAKTAVLDTADTLIVGKGNFNFDAETVYLDLTPYHKRARLFTLGAPVEVRGTLAKPELDLEKTGLAQQLGAALGLGVLIPGLGAILPFVDTGLGPQNACRRSLAAFK